MYFHQIAQIKELLNSVRYIVWNRQEFLNDQITDVTAFYNLLEECERFELNVHVLTFD